MAKENPRLFLDQFTGPLILDEATLAPEIFTELKKRVDEERRQQVETGKPVSIDVWITGSNQTLLQQAVHESLAGWANYFYLNTLSLHEWEKNSESSQTLRSAFMLGGWPELYANRDLDPVPYMNDFIATFIEKDIVTAAGLRKDRPSAKPCNSFLAG